MSLPRRHRPLLTLVLLAGCGGASHLPKPRPPEAELPDPVPTPAVVTSPMAVDSQAAAGHRPVAVATAAVAGPAEAGPRAAALPFSPADPAALQLSIPPIEPGRLLTIPERRRLSIERMRKITAAIAAYAAEHGRLPPVASYDEEKCPTLSWRVLLLPYLGHRDLLARFKLNEPFNSPHNLPLLAQIPPVYQCPDRPDQKTNYLLPVGDHTPFQFGTPDGCSIQAVQDGLENTAVLVEVDHVLAVEWSRPIEYTVSPQQPRRGLETLRHDGVFLGWGDGTVGCWPHAAPADKLGGLFSSAGNESGLRPLSIAAVAGDDAVAPASAKAAGGPASAAPPAVALVTNTSSSAMDTAAGEHPATTAEPPPETVVTRLAPPDQKTQWEILVVLRQTYEQMVTGKTDSRQQRANAARLLADANAVGSPTAERYVLLDVACKFATQAGDVALALDILDQLSAAYDVDLLPRQVEILNSSAGTSLNEQDNERVLTTAQRLITQAIRTDAYDLAADLHAVALSAARRAKNPQAIARLNRYREELSAARRQYEEVHRLLDAAAAGESSPQANQKVGAYLCFAKDHWERGLPLLAAGADSQLALLASAELAVPSKADAQMKLADGWWQQAEVNRSYRQACLRRAEHWYRQALPGLADSLLLKVRAEMRLEELARQEITPSRPE